MVSLEQLEVEMDEIVEDKEVLEFMRGEYLKKKRITKVQKDIANMLSDMKTMSGDECRTKWGKPEQVFAKLQFELIKAKKDLFDCDECKGLHKVGDCEGTKQTSVKS